MSLLDIMVEIVKVLLMVVGALVIFTRILGVFIVYRLARVAVREPVCYCLLAVAVRRARGLGRGGDITKHFNPGASKARGPLATVRLYGFDEMPVLIPELADVYGALGGLEKLESSLCEILRAEGKEFNSYTVNAELLPLDLQIALKKAAWATTTIALNMIQSKETKEWIASLLTTCNPRAVELKVQVNTRRGKPVYYNIAYSCKSHVYDDLRMEIVLNKYKDKPDIYLAFKP
jgi:hypothetical protein